MTRTTEHSATIWTRDRHRTAWAWSCLCGRRYDHDLPTIDAAREEARTHCSAANRGC